jgi:hypothetical protein
VPSTQQEDAIDRGIMKHMARIQGLLIPGLLAIIGFFVVRVFSTVEAIDADNQRFNTYVITNNQRMDNLEGRVKKVEDGGENMRHDVLALDKRESDAWAEFWKDYGFILNPPRNHAKPIR